MDFPFGRPFRVRGIDPWSAVQIALIFGVFLYYFVENFILSQGWEVLILRDVDDLAMQQSVHNLQKAIFAGDWHRVLTCFDYAYGNAFWLFSAIVLMPFYVLDNAQAQIVAGRDLSLIFVFASIYVVGRIIDVLRSESRELKYPILLILALAPMNAIIATKLHVNAQSIFFGVLAYYLLIRSPVPSAKTAALSAVFAGLAIGFKLTGVFILPVLYLTLLYRGLKRGFGIAVLLQALFSAIMLLIAAACTAPILPLFPFFMDEARQIYGIFEFFRNLRGSDPIPLTFGLFVSSLAYYVDALVLAAAAVLFLVIVKDEAKRGSYELTIVLASVVISVAVGFVVTGKSDLYIATYIQGVAFFIPLGLLGAGVLLGRAPTLARTLSVYALIAAGAILAREARASMLSIHDFYAMAERPYIKEQVAALDDMKKIILPLQAPIRVLQDLNTAAPVTNFTDGVTLTFLYADFERKKGGGPYDYVLLSKERYFTLGLGTADRQQDPATPTADEATRRHLVDDGVLFGNTYDVVYDRHGEVLYRLRTRAGSGGRVSGHSRFRPSLTALGRVTRRASVELTGARRDEAWGCCFGFGGPFQVLGVDPGVPTRSP